MSKVANTSKKAKVTLEDQIDALARIVVSGFEQVEKRFEQVNKRFEQVEQKFQHIDTEFVFIRHELKDHRERLERIERKQIGVLETLDESVHRSEFKGLVRRVEALETKSSKKS